MAVTRIIPIRGSKGQSVIKSLTERTDYVKNPEKPKMARWYTPTDVHRSSSRLSLYSQSGNMCSALGARLRA